MENQNKTLFFYGEKTSDYKEKKEVRRVTVAGVVDGNVIRIGVAQCNKKDRFEKAKGRMIATGRAQSKSPEDMVRIQEDMTVQALFINHAKKLVD